MIVLTLAAPALAQQPQPQPTLDQVLAGVQKNFEAYLHAIPNFFADEHLATSMSVRDEGDGRGGMNSTTDSSFFLKRSNTGDNPNRLVESREIKSVDHRPMPTGVQLSGPVILSGAFSYGASFLSVELKRCYDYSLLPSRRLNNATVLVVDYTLKPGLTPSALCPVSEPNLGRAFIDPASMQIVRLEQRRPHHKLDPGTIGSGVMIDPVYAGGWYGPDPKNPGNWTELDPGSWADIAPGTIGTWAWSIDYAPVSIDNKYFWLPKTITSTTSTTVGRLINWSFVASYSNYHLFAVSSTIVPVESSSQR